MDEVKPEQTTEVSKEVVKKETPKEVSAQDFLDALKPLNVEVTTDAHKRITIRKDKNVLTYVSDRKKGFSYSVKDKSVKWGWRAINVKTNDDMLKAVEDTKKLIPA